MTLHFVGETTDKRTAHTRAQAGELVSIAHGVYADAGDDIDAAILGHAIRIAHYLYPRAYLSSATSVLLTPTEDGRIFISGARNQRTRLRTLEIIQNEAPQQPSTSPVIVGDDMGEMNLSASSLRQRFLEAFRMRSEHASAITPAMRTQMADRLVEEFGHPRSAADALFALARDNGWYREGEGAERYLLARPAAGDPPANKAALDLIVAWHANSLGHLTHDGFEWRWSQTRKATPPLVRETTPGKLPPFIESLLPEGWLAEVLREKDARQALRQGRRYLSNITVARTPAELKSLPLDVLEGELASFTRNGRFTGAYGGPTRGEFEQTFEENLAQIAARPGTPRLSGVQIKAPMCLTQDGNLLPADARPFTHILKPAGTGAYDVLPVVEWVCLGLGRAAEFDVPAFAIVQMPDDMPPALLVERFDIRRSGDDRRQLALEDFCSVLDLPATAKYDGTIERMARGLRPISTDPAADIEVLFRRALFAWLIADGDMHLKNVALLKTAMPGERVFASVRFAPLYDPVTTRVFPGLHRDRMALKLNGKDDRLTRQDFTTLARTIDLPIARANDIISDMAGRVRTGAAQAVPPAPDDKRALQAVEKLRAIIMERALPFL